MLHWGICMLLGREKIRIVNDVFGVGLCSAAVLPSGQDFDAKTWAVRVGGVGG